MAGQYIEVCIKNVTINTGIEGLPPDFLKSKILAVSLKKPRQSENTHNSLRMKKKGGKDKNCRKQESFEKIPQLSLT